MAKKTNEVREVLLRSSDVHDVLKKGENPAEFNLRVEREWDEWRERKNRRQPRYVNRYTREGLYWNRYVRNRFRWNRCRWVWQGWNADWQYWQDELRQRHTRPKQPPKVQSNRPVYDRRGRRWFQPMPYWERERARFFVFIGVVVIITVAWAWASF